MLLLLGDGIEMNAQSQAASCLSSKKTEASADSSNQLCYFIATHECSFAGITSVGLC